MIIVIEGLVFFIRPIAGEVDMVFLSRVFTEGGSRAMTAPPSWTVTLSDLPRNLRSRVDA